MSLVNGINGLVYFFENGQWYPAACYRSSSRQLSTAMVDTSVSGTGIFGTSAPTRHTYTITVEGLVSLNPSASLSLADLTARQIALTKMLCRQQVQSEDGTFYTEQFYAYITGSSWVNSFDNVGTFNVDLAATGAITQLFTPIVQPQPIMYRKEYTATFGDTQFIDPTLTNKQPIAAGKDLFSFPRLIIGTGSPASNEMVYDPATGTFKWLVPAEAGEGVWVDYQNL